MSDGGQETTVRIGGMAAAKIVKVLVGIAGALALASAPAYGSAPGGPADAVPGQERAASFSASRQAFFRLLDAAPGQDFAAGSAGPAQDFSGPPGSAAVSIQPDDSSDRDTAYRLELTSSRSDPEGSLHPRIGLTWNDRFRIDGELRHADLVGVRVEGRFVDLRAPTENGDFAFVEGARDSREENRVDDVTVTAGLLSDRLRFTLRHASSSYRLFGSYSKRPTTKNKRRDDDEGRERFLNRGNVEGAAVLQRFDADVWRSAALNVAVFGLHSHVDRDFQSVEASGNDPFATSNRETHRAGTTLGLGPLQVTLARELSRRIDAPEEAQYEATVGLDLNDLRSRAGGGHSEGLWALAPSSAWVTVARGTVEGTSGPGAPDDRTEDISFGFSWAWPDSYASVDFWHSRYDYRQPGAGDYDWAGSGGYGGVGFGGERWGFEAGLGFYRSENKEVTSRSTDFGYDGSLSFSYRPQHLPDVSADLFLGRYGTDYVASGGSGRTDIWHAGMTMDFSKYLSDWLRDADPGLKLVYRSENSTNRGSFAGLDDDASHTVAVLFRMGF
jgi:hypothetical protein